VARGPLGRGVRTPAARAVPSSPGRAAAVQYSSAMGRERPNGTVTFLFTEIEESARRPQDAAADLASAL
jgi:hypothetical protein